MAFLTNDERQAVPLEFSLRYITFKWGDIWWGYKHEFLPWYDVVYIAKKRVMEDLDFEEYDLVSSIADVNKSNIWMVSAALEKLAKLEPTDPESAKHKFLFLALAWGYENRHKYNDPLDAVSFTFEQFGCPDEISHIVPWMPATSAYDSSEHSLEDPIKKLHSRWQKYLHDNGYEPGE